MSTSASTWVVIGARIAFTPPANARSTSRRCKATTPWCSATSEDEHVVVTGIATPSSPNW